MKQPEEQTGGQMVGSILPYLLVGLVLAALTLWIVWSAVGGIMAVTEVLAVCIFGMVSTGDDFDAFGKLNVRSTTSVSLLADVALAISAVSLAVCWTVNIHGGFVQLVASLACTSLLPGFALLNVLNVERYFSRLETLVVSVVLSYALVGCIEFLLIPFTAESRILVSASVLFSLGAVSAIMRTSRTERTKPSSFSRHIDFLVILFVVAFLALLLLLMYPGYVLSPGTDIITHYSLSLRLGRLPLTFPPDYYLLAHLQEWLFLELSSSSYVPELTALAVLSLVLPLAFYAMAKSYLDRVNPRFPSIAIMVWSLLTNGFGGFAWVYYIYLKLAEPLLSGSQLFSRVNSGTYDGVAYGVLGLWNVPEVTAIALTLVLLLLLTKSGTPRVRFIGLYALLILAAWGIYVPYGAIITLFVGILSLFKGQEVQIKSITLGAIIGTIGFGACEFAFSLVDPEAVLGLQVLLSVTISVLVATSGLLISVVRSRNDRLRDALQNLIASLKHRLGFPACYALVACYVIALLSWPLFWGVFQTSQVDYIGYVPWFMYPVMLGPIGLLGVLTFLWLARGGADRGHLSILAWFALFAFVLGVAVSFVNLNYFFLGYFEKRFVLLLKIPLALLTPIAFLLLLKRFERAVPWPTLRKAGVALIVGGIVMSGMLTTVLNASYWNTQVSNQSSLITSDELSATAYLQGALNGDPRAWVVAVSGTSASIASIGGIASFSQQLATSQTPEMGLNLLQGSPLSTHAYIFVTNSDESVLSSSAFLASYLKYAPVAYNDTAATIYSVPHLAPPQVESPTVLAVPELVENSTDIQLAYSLLSQGGYNYTTAEELDQRLLNTSLLILPSDPPSNSSNAVSFDTPFNNSLGSWSVSQGSWRVLGTRLIGGTTGGTGFIISPVQALNFSASFSITPLSANTKALNYAQLVYSWTGPEDYRSVDVEFNPNGYLYVLAQDVENGVESNLLPFPGANTGLKWSLGAPINVTVDSTSTAISVSIDGKSYLSVPQSGIAGSLGLGYFRFGSVAFDGFTVTGSLPSTSRPLADYIRYVNDGGRLIVVNANGYGPFSKMIFNSSTVKVACDAVDLRNTTLPLPEAASTPVLTPENASTRTIDTYSCNGQNVPFVTETGMGKGTLFYVNIHPLVDQITSTGSAGAFKSMLGRLLADLPLTATGPVNLRIDAYASGITLRNGVAISTASVIVPPGSGITEVLVDTAQGVREFLDVSQLTSVSPGGAEVKTASASTIGGRGFYAQLELNSSAQILPLHNTLEMTLTEGGSVYSLQGVFLVTVMQDRPWTMLVRTPEIRANESDFGGFLPITVGGTVGEATGQTLKVNGTTSFAIPISDSYYALSSLTLGRSVALNPPLITFDVLASLPSALGPLAVVSVFSLIYWFNRRRARPPA